MSHLTITRAPSQPALERDMRYDIAVQMESHFVMFEDVPTDVLIWHPDQMCNPAGEGTSWPVIIIDGQVLAHIIHGAASEECDP